MDGDDLWPDHHGHLVLVHRSGACQSSPPSCLLGRALEGPGGPAARPWQSPTDTCLVSLGWGRGRGLHGSRPRDRVLGVLAVPWGLSPPFGIRGAPLATARPGLQVLGLGEFGVRDSKRAWLLFRDPAIGLGAGISGRPRGPGIGQGAGHGAPLDLPGVWACCGRARFPGRALGAISSRAVPQGSRGPHRPQEAIFLPGP